MAISELKVTFDGALTLSKRPTMDPDDGNESPSRRLSNLFKAMARDDAARESGRIVLFEIETLDARSAFKRRL